MDYISSFSIEKPKRWDEPFGTDMTMADVERVLAIRPFNLIDQALFPRRLSLPDILLNDARIVHYQRGDIIVRRQDYGHSAFFILDGSVLVDIGNAEECLPAYMLGRKESRGKGLWNVIAQLWRNPRWSEVRPVLNHSEDLPSRRALTADADSSQVRLHDVDTVVDRYHTSRRLHGTFFGEVAALGRTARTATIFTDTDTTLLEIRWQGLREMRRYAPEIRDLIDQRYRQSSLETHLFEAEIFRHLDGEALEQVKQQTLFDSYGDFDWYESYKQQAAQDPDEQLENEPTIAYEGDYPNGVILISGGFARLSRQFANSHITLSYLGRGQVYGLQEIAQNWREQTQIPLQTTLSAIGHVDMLYIPTSVIEKYVLPTLPARLWPNPVDSHWNEATSPQQIESRIGIRSNLLEQLVDHRFINGTATLLIDMDRCTRCDDCVRACAVAHDNNPRFLRDGTRFEHYLVANACMHCIDPLCLIGCPTGAISRNIAGGQIIINDQTCIGCATCANNCPYNAIRMVGVCDENGNMLLDQQSHMPIRKATKCDLCVEQLSGPACQRACPHGALKRVNMSDPAVLAKELNVL